MKVVDNILIVREGMNGLNVSGGDSKRVMNNFQNWDSCVRTCLLLLLLCE